MSQYYQLTSWEDIYRLYPNLQVDNIDSVQYMVQDDKVIQKTGGQNERRPNYQMELQNESPRRFISQEIVRQNHVPRTVQGIIQQTEYCNIVKTTETITTTNACSEQHKGGQNNQTSGQSPQIKQFIQIENSEIDNSSKSKPETSLQLDKAGPTLISMQSPVSTSNLPPYKRITLKQNQSDTYPTGVLIIPSSDNQSCIGQFQAGFRLQGTQTLPNTVMKQSGGDNKTKFNDKGSQTGDISSHNIVVQQESSVLLFPAPSDSQKASSLTGLNQHKMPFKTHIKSGSLDPAAIKTGEIMIASRVPQSSVNRIPTLLVLTPEQTSEPIVKEGERREIIVQPCGPSYVSQSATVHSPNPSQTSLKIGKGVGRGSKAGLSSPNQKLVLPTSPTIHGVQNSLDRLIQAEVVNPGKKSKGVSNVGASGWTSNTQDLRNQVGPRPVIYQLASVNNSNLASNNSLINTNNINAVNSTANVYINNSYNSVSNSDGNQCAENADETRMLVLLPNGEKKLVRFPNTQQNIQIQQLWQQVRFSLGSQISLVSNEQAAEKTSTSQLTKGVALENQESKPTHDTSNIIQINSSSSNNPGKVQSSPTVAAQQQRPRGVSPRPGNNASGSNAFKSRTQGNIPRMPTPRIINQHMVTPQHHQSQTLVTQNNTLSGVVTQVQPVKDAVTPPQQPKEVPKFIPGQVAICPFCGISSLDFNKCIRCRRKLPPNVKSQSIFTAEKKSPDIQE